MFALFTRNRPVKCEIWIGEWTPGMNGFMTHLRHDVATSWSPFGLFQPWFRVFYEPKFFWPAERRNYVMSTACRVWVRKRSSASSVQGRVSDASSQRGDGRGRSILLHNRLMQKTDGHIVGQQLNEKCALTRNWTCRVPQACNPNKFKWTCFKRFACIISRGHKAKAEFEGEVTVTFSFNVENCLRFITSRGKHQIKHQHQSARTGRAARRRRAGYTAPRVKRSNARKLSGEPGKVNCTEPYQ